MRNQSKAKFATKEHNELKRGLTTMRLLRREKAKVCADNAALSNSAPVSNTRT